MRCVAAIVGRACPRTFLFRLPVALAVLPRLTWPAGAAVGAPRSRQQQAIAQKPVPADTVAALRRKAELGNAAAQLAPGVLYASGRGVPLDFVQAVAGMGRAASEKRRK